MIKATCTTNLDDYKSLDWPEFFVAVPNKGDKVLSLCGRKLTVVQITHCVDICPLGGAEPYIEIELGRNLIGSY